MTSLIIGCGYLGRRVATRWRDTGEEVFALTRSTENAEKFRSDGIHPIIGDICRRESLRKLPAVETVLYCVGFDRNSGNTHEEVTCDGLQNFLLTLGSDCRRFVYVSSTSVYGQNMGEWVNEQSICEPTQIGGQLNLRAEQIVNNHFKLSDVSTVAVRLAGIYGPQRLLSRIESLRDGQPIAGRGDAWLNLIHVDDAANAVVACVEQGVKNSTYIVADDQPIRRQDYFELLADLVNAPPPKFDSSQTTTRGSGGLNKRCSNQKIRLDLSWKPNYSSILSGLPAALSG